MCSAAENLCSGVSKDGEHSLIGGDSGLDDEFVPLMKGRSASYSPHNLADLLKKKKETEGSDSPTKQQKTLMTRN